MTLDKLKQANHIACNIEKFEKLASNMQLIITAVQTNEEIVHIKAADTDVALNGVTILQQLQEIYSSLERQKEVLINKLEEI